VRQFALRVAEIAALGGLIQVTCAGPDPGAAPGQVCLAWAGVPAQPFVRVPLFLGPTDAPDGAGAQFFIPIDHPYAHLQPGDDLDVLGPCGRGFRLPPTASHLLVVAGSLDRLLPTIYHALRRGWAVSVLTPRRADALPADVEVQRGPLSAEMAAWADVIALDVADPRARAQHIRALLPGRAPGSLQALVVPPMPCGVGACHACWVDGRNPGQRRLACVEGPVLSL
jgi:hypothetical protein